MVMQMELASDNIAILGALQMEIVVHDPLSRIWRFWRIPMKLFGNLRQFSLGKCIPSDSESTCIHAVASYIDLMECIE
ncbi:MAG: hypothetical protein CMJ17_15840 [Phenylobacterium sp.]|jgi:hypothetical protein|nr:hypothetical protein [Phenylobacterium sp.]|tara:strand:- start:26137 stop:26370 length:234 start_codon:yes stop_codon:yes gene_type:complete